ncbi:MAG: hypothetical protein GY934_24150, partial [Gammaproteobacteria bacterium]|nr:hypothetical protein [Gammaproteobacteria bacterium]
SGGSIWLDVGTLVGDAGGAARIQADGGSGSYIYGGGSGGRIAIYYAAVEDFDLESQVSAKGAVSYYGTNGEDGTIHTEQVDIATSIVSVSSQGLISNALDKIDVFFINTIDEGTFTAEDVSLILATQPIVISGISKISSVQYQIDISAPLVDGAYDLTIGPDIQAENGQGMDQDEDGTAGEALEDQYHAQFSIDTLAPSAPGVDVDIAPVVNIFSKRQVTLTGTREANTSIWINGVLKVVNGSEAWDSAVALQEGPNQITVTAKDLAGNASAPVQVLYDVDSVVPVITATLPAHNSYLSVVPATMDVTVVEEGSGIDVSSSTLFINRGATAIPGNWQLVGNVIKFTPNTVFIEGVYQLRGKVFDIGGGSSSEHSSIFVIDQTPPTAPVLDAIPAVTTIDQHTVTGSKEANSAIWLNGAEVVAHTASTSWSHVVPLSEGQNDLSFSAKDRAGNTSIATDVSIVFDNTAPGAVTPVVTNVGDGTSITIDWSGYDEVANGNDIENYRIYRSNATYSNTGSATLITTLAAGQKQYQMAGLTRGSTYHIAVVAFDTMGNSNSSVTPTAITLVDEQPAGEVSGVGVESFADRLKLTWVAPTDSDLAGFRFYFNNDSGTELTAATLSREVSGLTAASGYPVRITTLDNDGNESEGVAVTGVTLLPNPTGLSAEVLDSQIELSWDAVAPAEFVKQHAIYVQPSAFSSVDGLSPQVIVAAGTTQASVAGLSNGVAYHFAVTTINLSDGQTAAVSSIEATPSYDTVEPTINAVSLNSVPLAEGGTVTKSGVLSIDASDTSGVGRVEFHLDGSVFASDNNPADGFSTLWDVEAISDGAHVLSIAVYDTLGNEASLDLNLTVALAAPVAPGIETPAGGHQTNSPQLQVSGTAAPNSEVKLYIGATQAAGPLSVDSAGKFTGAVTLNEGSNDITATASNRGGESLPSSAVTVTLDTSQPDAPSGLTAQSKGDGQVVLSWNVSSDQRVVSYDLYRSTTPFTAIADATKANSNPLTEGRFTDLPTVDGDYIYRVVALNELETPSEPSAAVTAASDRELPKAVAITYTPSGVYDAASGRMAPGLVTVDLEVNEPLLTTPFLSIAPAGGTAIAVQLSKVDDTHYQGSFEITGTTPSGTAYAIFSARDVVGNRGDEILAGTSIEIDTAGPEATRLTVAPASPIKTDQAEPTEISVEIELDQPLKSGTTPQLGYLLSGPDRINTTITGLVPVTETVWRGSFSLPADAGLASSENLQFTLQALDDMDNVG